jgi:molybdenum cofactor cytidylyltransferase
MGQPGLILLAAGGSTRMGRPKQLLPWGESTLLRHACETAIATGCSPIIVVLGCEEKACRKVLHGLPVVITTNADWKKGLGSSLEVGVKKLEEEAPHVSGTLIMLADQPTVTADFLTSLLASWKSPERPIAATLYGKEGGVPAVFDRSYFSELRSLEHDRGARALIARDIAFTVLVDPGGNLIDLDTPAAYREHHSQ